MVSEKLAVIHTGFHKTGSSSVQYTLAHNRRLLKKHGYHYPDITIDGVSLYNYSVSLYGRYCDRPENFQHYGFHNNLDAKVANQAVDKLFELQLWAMDKLVFSDEFASSLEEHELIRLRDDFQRHGYRLRVISYIREPFNRLVSAVQQRTKLRSTINHVLENESGVNEAKKIQRLIRVFGADAEFYSFEKTCEHSAGPAGFLFTLLGLDLPADKALKVNESLSSQAVRLLSYINESAPLILPGGRLNPVRKKYDVLPLFKLKGEKFMLTAAEVEQVMPELLEARTAISKLLGDNFLPAVKFRSSDDMRWDAEHVRALIKISPGLDLQILLRSYDYLCKQNTEASEFQAEMETLAQLIRGRLDAAMPVKGRYLFLRSLAMRLRIYPMLKWFRARFPKLFYV